MAIVNVSRIQTRRGRKNEGVGVPQLASGELAWSIDTREFYIGNGSVQEGAPFVGNTKILTEHDDLLNFLTSYVYRVNDPSIQTGDTANTPVERSIQDRLDDFVNVKNFGVNMDGTDESAPFQRAIDQLFLNTLNKSDPASRVVLYLPPGELYLESTIYVPPYVNIVGAGKDKTIITSSVAGPSFITVNLDSLPGAPADESTTTLLNQPQYINMHGFTLDVQSANTALSLVNCANSNFSSLRIKGTWENLDALVSASRGISFKSLDGSVRSYGNKFDDVEIEGFSYLVYSDYDIQDNVWEHCNFSTGYIAVMFGLTTDGVSDGQITGPVRNLVLNCVFDDIDRQAFKVVNGEFNVSKNNKYYAVGNNGGTSLTATYPIIDFDNESANNKSFGDWFERTYDLSVSPDFAAVPYVPEISNQNYAQYSYELRASVLEHQTPVSIFKLPADVERVFAVQYTYTSSNYDIKRVGTLKISVDPDLPEYHIIDEYDFFGNETYAESITFTIVAGAQTVNNTLLVSLSNTAVGDNGVLDFKVTSISS